MIIHKKENTTFLLDIHKQDDMLSTLYTDAVYNVNQTKGSIPLKTTSNQKPSFPLSKKHIYSVSYIPEYVRLTPSNAVDFRVRSFKSVKGYSVWLGECSTMKDFLPSLRRSQRKSLSRSLKRLDSCFDMKYKMYHGEISMEHYSFLMDTLKSMILKRFEQRGETSESIALWDKIHSTSFDLINNRKASLFVGYNDTEPVSISLNYHYDKILFGYVTSYNIDYSKFSLGQIGIYKRLEWCLENGYELFEMGWGDLAYKKWWSNNIYNFRHEFIFPKGSPIANSQVMFYGYKTEIMAYLISKNVNIYYRRFKSFFSNKKYQDIESQYALVDVKFEHNDYKNKPPIPLSDSEIPRSIIYDFLFLSQTKLSNISVYSMDDEKNYIITGNKMTKKIVYTPND